MIIDCPLTTVMSRLSRARVNLRTLLVSRTGTSMPLDSSYEKEQAKPPGQIDIGDDYEAGRLQDYDYPTEEIAMALAGLPAIS